MPIQIGYVAAQAGRFVTTRYVTRKGASYTLKAGLRKSTSHTIFSSTTNQPIGLLQKFPGSIRFDYPSGFSSLEGSLYRRQGMLTGLNMRFMSNKGIHGELFANIFDLKKGLTGKGSLGNIYYDLYKSRYVGHIQKQYQFTLGSILRNGSDPNKPSGVNPSGGLIGLHKHVVNGLGNASNGLKPNINVDTRKFDEAIREYVKYSRKDLTTIVNQKLYWVCINAIGETFKADKQTITNDLDKESNTMPGLTVAEAMAVVNARKKNLRLTKSELKRDANKIKQRRKRAVGFLRSGWIPAIKRVAPYAEVKTAAKRASREDSRLRGKEKGGAAPALKAANADVVMASAWNDIIADNNPRAQQYMQVGLQRAMDREAASMMQYVQNKIQKNNDRFNRR